MNSYERVRAAVEHRQPDRAPCDFSAEPDVEERLCHTLGLKTRTELLKHLGIDRRTVGPCYTGPALRRFADGSYENIVSGGPIVRDIPSPTGVNPTTVWYPWADVTRPEDLEGRWGWNGRLEWWDFSTIPAQIDALEEEGPYWISAHGDPSGLQHLEMWVGDEKFLLLLAQDPDLAVAMIEKHNQNRLAHALKTLEAGAGRIHELNGGGDYGAQNGLLISPRMFRRYFKEIYINFYREIKKHFNVEIFFHSCGSVVDLIPDLIDIGVTILDPIQVKARGMEIGALKACFGDRLVFHGGIDIQELMPYGSPEEVRREVRRTLDTLGQDGGYILAPTHALQSDIPLENILAMYTEAQGRNL
jgi:uroporphyrinogen decarboxylase